MPSKPRLIVVANRLPVQRVASRWEPSPGGLASAVLPVAAQTRGAWVGWTGVASQQIRPFEINHVSIRPVSLTAREIDVYYNQFSNRTLWPLYHDAIRTPEFERTWWRPYVEVNQRFARTAAKLAKPGDMVWIHDYHLQLVPQMIRDINPGVKIGFFLHIPFPPEELFAWLPWRKELLRGILGADVVGFQTQPMAQNFVRVAKEHTDADGSGRELIHEGRHIHVASFPISIDVDDFERTAASPDVERLARDVRRRIGDDRKILLAVDRLDYTKGIDARLKAFELLLKSGRVTADNCVLVQIAVPSREPVPDYDQMRTTIEQIVGRINGEFSTPGRVAVHYFRRSFARKELVAYYKAADVMIVTPLRDGMNLVAKEYCATRRDLSGVLILSEFAGAAKELRRALLVNPRDIEAMSETMYEAMRLPRREANLRMAMLRTQVRRHNVHDWASEFMEAMRNA